jgi:hypothetical protein
MGINSFSPANHVGAATAKSLQSTGVLNLTTGAARVLSVEDLWVTQVSFYGIRGTTATATTPNTGPIFVGLNGAMSNTIAPGAQFTVAPPLGSKLNLKDWRAAGTTGDGVVCIYNQ